MAPAPAAVAGLAPRAVQSSLLTALDEPKTTAGLDQGAANVGNAVPASGNNGGLGAALTSELESILGGGIQTPANARTSTTSARTTTTTSARALTPTSRSSTTTQRTSTTTTSSTTTSRSTTSTTSTSTSSSTTSRAPTSPTTSLPTVTFPSHTSSSTVSPTALGNAAGSATSSGLSQPAMIGIIVGSVAVAVFIILFVLRKLCLVRRKRERIQWEAGLASYNAPKRAGSNEKVEAEVARRLNANVVAPMAPLPAALPREPPSPRSPTTNMTKRPMQDMGRPVQIRPPLPPPAATNMIGPYPVFAASTSPPREMLNAGNNNMPSTNSMPSSNSGYGLAPPPPSLAPAQGVFKAVLTTYSPQLPDELPLTIGERVRVIEVFEDGWAMVERVGPGPTGGMMEKGVVPAECLGLSPPGQR